MVTGLLTLAGAVSGALIGFNLFIGGVPEALDERGDVYLTDGRLPVALTSATLGTAGLGLGLLRTKLSTKIGDRF